MGDIGNPLNNSGQELDTAGGCAGTNKIACAKLKRHATDSIKKRTQTAGTWNLDTWAELKQSAWTGSHQHHQHLVVLIEQD